MNPTRQLLWHGHMPTIEKNEDGRYVITLKLDGDYATREAAETVLLHWVDLVLETQRKHGFRNYDPLKAWIKGLD